MALLSFLKRGLRRILRHRKVNVRYPYPISIRSRDLAAETLPANGGVEAFDKPAASQINEARLAHLASLKLPLEGKRVLDIGCGVGHLAQFFVQRGCEVVCVDGRAENIAQLRQLYPGITAYVADVETQPLSDFGNFDVVFCYGLLYHLENPIAALRNIASVRPSLFLLETMVCDSHFPVLRLDDETKAYSQALHGLGCRPSPTFIVAALNRIGFSYIYGPKHAPKHPDFRFRWRNNLDVTKNNHSLRCIFVVSATPLRHRHLINLLPK